MKSTVVNSHTLLDDTNKRSCISPHRVLERCYKCHLYKNCESKIVSHKYDNLMEEKSILLEKLKKISQDIEEL